MAGKGGSSCYQVPPTYPVTALWFKICQSEESPVGDFALEMSRLEKEEEVFDPVP